MPKTKSVSVSKKKSNSDLEELKALGKNKERVDSSNTSASKLKPKRVKLSNVLKLSENSLKPINKNLKIFSIVLLIYYLLTLLLVRGFTATINVASLKKGSFGSDLSVFNNILGTGVSSTSSSGDLFQTILFVIFSIIFIWMLRETLKGRTINVRDSFYKTQTAFIQFIIIMIFLFIELIPLILGLFLLATVFSTGIAVHVSEQTIWFLVFLGFAAVTFYFLIPTIFALYIVTLPDVRPIQAFRSAWRLVKKRRLLIFRKLIFLPIAILLFVGILSLIFIALIPQIADFVYFALAIIAVLLAHSYIYTLYRELI